MVLIKEFHIPMPLTLEEYRLGQRYSAARVSKEATTGKDGVEVLETTNYVDETTGETGLYTFKVYYLDGYVPGWLRPLLPASAMQLHEKAWDRFPYCKTVITNPFLGEKFSFEIESMHAPDLGEQYNILQITDKKVLKKKEIQFLDIAKDQPLNPKYYKAEEDPSKVGNKRFGPLSDGWQKVLTPVMCCYKLVSIRAKIWGLQTRCEEFMINMERDIFLKFHQQIFVWFDDWYGKSEDEINKLVQEMEEDMRSTLAKAEKEDPGMVAERR